MKKKERLLNRRPVSSRHSDANRQQETPTDPRPNTALGTIKTMPTIKFRTHADSKKKTSAEKVSKKGDGRRKSSIILKESSDFKTYHNGRLDCPKGEKRCQLWKVPIPPHRVHEPVFVSKRSRCTDNHKRLIYKNFIYSYPEHKLYCPNCEMYFHSEADYHNHLLLMDNLAPLTIMLETYLQENKRINEYQRKSKTHGEKMIPITTPLSKISAKSTKSRTHAYAHFIDGLRYYDSTKAELAIVETNRKISAIKEKNTVDEMKRVMLKKKNSMEILRRQAKDKVKRLEKKAKRLEEDICALTEKLKGAKSAGLTALANKLQALKSQINEANQEEETIADNNRRTTVMHQRKLDMIQSKLELESSRTSQRLSGFRSSIRASLRESSGSRQTVYLGSELPNGRSSRPIQAVKSPLRLRIVEQESLTSLLSNESAKSSKSSNTSSDVNVVNEFEFPMYRKYI